MIIRVSSRAYRAAKGGKRACNSRTRSACLAGLNKGSHAFLDFHPYLTIHNRVGRLYRIFSNYSTKKINSNSRMVYPLERKKKIFTGYGAYIRAEITNRTKPAMIDDLYDLDWMISRCPRGLYLYRSNYLRTRKK